MTTQDDRETLERIIGLLSDHADEALVTSDPSKYDAAELIPALRSALQVPDAAQADPDWCEGCKEAVARARRETIEEAARVVMSARVHQAWKLWKVGGVTQAELDRADCFDDAMRYEIRDAIRAIAAQSAARGEMEHDKPEAVPSNRAAETLVWNAASGPHPLDDAAVLERAAEILSTLRTAADQDPAVKILRANVAILRQPPAPEPAPDVFGAFSVWTDDRDHKWIEAHAREWFGPLVEFTQDNPCLGCTTVLCWPCVYREKLSHLAQIRARAKEVSRG